MPNSMNTHSDRRTTPRQAWCAPGFVYVDDDVTQVELRDISRDLEAGGVGFISPLAFDAGTMIGMRIGLGPVRAPKQARVAYCRGRPDGRFWVGVEFVQQLAQAA
jgi:hypothetical protein